MFKKRTIRIILLLIASFASWHLLRVIGDNNLRKEMIAIQKDCDTCQFIQGQSFTILFRGFSIKDFSGACIKQYRDGVVIKSVAFANIYPDKDVYVYSVSYSNYIKLSDSLIVSIRNKLHVIKGFKNKIHKLYAGITLNPVSGDCRFMGAYVDEKWQEDGLVIEESNK